MEFRHFTKQELELFKIYEEIIESNNIEKYKSFVLPLLLKANMDGGSKGPKPMLSLNIPLFTTKVISLVDEMDKEARKNNFQNDLPTQTLRKLFESISEYAKEAEVHWNLEQTREIRGW